MSFTFNLATILQYFTILNLEKFGKHWSLNDYQQRIHFFFPLSKKWNILSHTNLKMRKS